MIGHAAGQMVHKERNGAWKHVIPAFRKTTANDFHAKRSKLRDGSKGSYEQGQGMNVDVAGQSNVSG